MSATNLRAEAQFRPTDWRWEKARLMREDPRVAALLRSQTDEWTVKAKQFQIEYDRAADDYDRLRLVRRWPALWDARGLRFEADQNRLARYEVEARLLAGDTPERIAARVACSPACVRWYEALFFNVTDRLHHRGWVGHCVIGESAQAGLTERDFDTLWKLFGFLGGPLVLDAVIDRGYDVTRPDGPGQMQDWLGDEVERTATIKMALAMRTMPINSYTQEKVAEIYLRYKEIQKMADGGGAVGDTLTNNIQLMIQAVPWTVGDKTVLVDAADPRRIVGRLRAEVAAADACAAELRSAELMQLNTGQRPDRLAEIQATRFPEKPHAAVN